MICPGRWPHKTKVNIQRLTIYLVIVLLMEATDLISLIEGLDENVDDLKEALAPLLQAALAENAAKLPLLDKAQLYVLVTYAIESLLFCRLFRFYFHPWHH